MAGLTVNEAPHGLKHRKCRPAKACESAVDGQIEPEGTGGGQRRQIALPGRIAPAVRQRDQRVLCGAFLRRY
jgi:hypothetical protein